MKIVSSQTIDETRKNREALKESLKNIVAFARDLRVPDTTTSLKHIIQYFMKNKQLRKKNGDLIFLSERQLDAFIVEHGFMLLGLLRECLSASIEHFLDEQVNK